MSNKILVTGAAGFIGFNLIKSFFNDDLEIIGIDNLNDYYDVELKKARLKILLKNKKFNFYKIDIRKKESLLDIFQKYRFSHVIHLAAQAGVRYSLENPQEYIDTNISGFLNIIESSKKNKPNILYASSSSVYGANKVLPFNESQKTEEQLSLYGVTKKTNEMMAYAYSHLYDINLIGLRFFTVYGPWGRPDMALFKFVKNILDSKPIKLFNHGNHVRSFTYIDDIVYSIRKILYKKGIFDRHKVFNIGGIKAVKLKDYITCIEDYLGKKANIDYLPLQLGDVEKTEASTTILYREINFEPSISIDEGIPKFIEWYKKFYKH